MGLFFYPTNTVAVTLEWKCIGLGTYSTTYLRCDFDLVS